MEMRQRLNTGKGFNALDLYIIASLQSIVVVQEGIASL
ncbi:predicted protein [Sclerotinia sclerotiorum 1980 UF-70]|uniref:Uncharacterized protein n=1 Tax=Sclerotinia sclerotiorum (strain ATCC 18683 / 1980 / Ss-1) TaxID=665079 RepID=A7F8X9_SCLS1|nr:predicted protein [Sclerotinia sclerotiorum 1980 UF-70]EDN99200.1 predicted protein [Sclerotinia sclerotiorum 1980 UF-70]